MSIEIEQHRERVRSVRVVVDDSTRRFGGGFTSSAFHGVFRGRERQADLESRATRMRGQLLPGVPTRQHIHTIVRTPNGNDYGKDLLRQHLEQHSHAAPAL